MITQETAGRIWNCYRELAVGKKLLADMEEELRQNPKAREVLRDAFGRRRSLQLGVPSSDDSHRLLDVEPKLACSVIRAHMANQEADLKAANEQARIELDEHAK